MSPLSVDDPKRRDNALRMAVRNAKSMRDGCVLVIAGGKTVRVMVYGEPLFEYDLRDRSFTVHLPQCRDWVVQKINACLSGAYANMRAFTEGGYVKLTDGGARPYVLERGGMFTYGGVR